ncbi:hypothetical protein Tco_0608233 [Tanacetum coccineum]
MNTTQAQQKALDDALVAPADPFLITIEVPAIYMQEFWSTVSVHRSSIKFTINKKKVSLNVEIFREILQICPKIPGQEFEDLPLEQEVLSFIRDLRHTRDITYLTDVDVDYLHQPWRAFATVINKCLSGKETVMDKIRLSHAQILWGMFHKKNVDYVYLLWEDFLFQIENKDAKKTNKMSYPRFIKVIINYFMSKDQSILRRNKMFWHTARDDTMFTSMRCISRHEDTQAYGILLPKHLTNQAMLESKAYQTYYAFASREKAPKPKYIRKKADSDTSPKKKPVQDTKGTRLKSKAKVAKPDKKKQPTKKMKAKGLVILSEVALSEAEQLKLATKRRKKYFHMSHVSGSGDGVDIQSKVPDDQQQKTSGTDEGTSTIPRVLDVPTYESKNEIPDLKLTNVDQTKHEEEEYDDEFYEEEAEENTDDEKTMYDDEDDEVTKELYEDVNVNLGNVDTEMTNADQGASDEQNVSQQSGFEQVEEDAHVNITLVHDTQKADEPVQSSSVSSDFTRKLLNLENPSPADNKIASLMETSDRHATTIPKNTSSFTTTIPPPPPFFNPLQQEATPTPTQITLETTTSLPALPDFAFVFKFNERVFNLEKDVSEIKQVNQYTQALSSILAIVDRYMDNKLREAINKAILAHNLDYGQEAQDEKNAYIELVNMSMRALIKEEKNVTESVEAVVLTRSSSQPTSTYEAAASLFEFELTKILIDKIEKNNHIIKLTTKRSFMMHCDKDRDPSVRSNRGKKRRKSSKDAESSKDSWSKEKKSSSTSKDASQSQHKSFGKSAHAEELSHTFKKPERPPTPNPDWSKRRQVDFRPPQNWTSQVAHAEEPPTSFDEFNDTSFDFSAFVINWLKIPNMTHEILVRPVFNLLKGTCKSITELEYHLEECSKATTERLDWHNPENKPYPFDLRKPYLLIQDHRGRQIIPKDYFINKDLEYLKGGDLSRCYSTSVTNKWIKDLVPEFNLTSSKDVYSRRRIIAVTRLIIMKKYDYGHLEEIEVRRDDQKLYTFKEGDFKRLHPQDIEDMLLLLIQ